ncbi:MAG: hypothetical protein V4607_06040 [Pseudomonadota bacterium]
MSPFLALPVSLILIMLGVRLLKDVQKARTSGIGKFFFQWPNNFERSHQPLAFWWSIALYTTVGYLAFIFAAVIAVQAVYMHGG